MGPYQCGLLSRVEITGAIQHPHPEPVQLFSSSAASRALLPVVILMSETSLASAGTTDG